MRDYVLKESYDNSMPLFLGGEHHGEIRLMAGAPRLFRFTDGITPEPPVYERWSVTCSREFVFYRLLGMTDAAAMCALVRLAMTGAARMPDRRTEEVPCTQ